MNILLIKIEKFNLLIFNLNKLINYNIKLNLEKKLFH